MKRYVGIFVVLFLLLGCGNRSTGSEIVRFEGGNLTAEDLKAHYQILKRQSKYRTNPEMLTPEFVYNHALNMEMIIAKGLDEKLHLDSRIRQEIHHFMSDLFLKVMQEKLVPQIDKNSIGEEEMRAYYEAHKENYQNSFEEKKAYIHNDVLYAKYRRAWEETYAQLKKEFKVKIDPQRLQAFYNAMAPVNNKDKKEAK